MNILSALSRCNVTCNVIYRTSIIIDRITAYAGIRASEQLLLYIKKTRVGNFE